MWYLDDHEASLAARMILVSSGAWVTATVLVIHFLYALAPSESRYRSALIVAICIAIGFGWGHMIHLLVGTEVFWVFTGDTDLLALKAFEKTSDAVVASAFIAPMVSRLAGEKVAWPVAVACSVVSVLYAIYFFALP
jgi:hypothetical protein